MRLAFALQAGLLALFVPVVLIVPEIPLGRVVAHDLRWMLAAAAGGLAVLSAYLAWRGEAAGPGGPLALAVSAVLGLVGLAVRGGGQAVAFAPLLVLSLALSVWRLRGARG